MEPPDTPETPKSRNHGIEGRVVREIGPFLTLGLQLAISVVVFFFIGYWLDGQLGTAPWCAIGGATLGTVGGLIKFLRDAMAIGRKADEIRKQHRED